MAVIPVFYPPDRATSRDDLENGPTEFDENLHAALKWDYKNYFLLAFF